MTEQHPITPPLELVQQWALMFESHTDTEVFAEVGRWFADQELDACCEWLGKDGWGASANCLRTARRPKPPSLKEQALAALGRLNSGSLCANPVTDKDTIRRALEALDD